MIGTSHRGAVQRSVFCCVLRIAVPCAQSKMAGAIYERQPTPALPPSGHLYTWAGRE
ncbi:unnamed protein product, partial [Staurois parvus]